MKHGWSPARFGDLIVENRKSTLQVRDSLPSGPFPFFTSGAKRAFANEFLCRGENLFLATGGKAIVRFHEGKAAYSTDCWSFTTRPDVVPKYLYYFLESHLEMIDADLFEGAALRHLQKPKLRNIPVPLPTVSEQRRIIAILDEASDAIERIRNHSEKNRHNARALFESHLQSALARRGPGWEDKRLSDVSLEFGRGKSKHRPRNDPKLYGGPYPFIQTGDISAADHWLTEYSQTYNEAGLAQSRLWPKGTICIAIVGATVGESAILAFDACFPDSTIGIVVNEQAADCEYVEYVLQAFKAVLKEKGKGAARDNINLGTFETQLFPFAPVPEQKRIVVTLNALREESLHLASIYDDKLDTLDSLKRSLLHQAFKGEL